MAAEAEDVTRLSAGALDAHIERCERLARRPALLARLPDGGGGIRRRLAAYRAESARRAQLSAAAGKSEETMGEAETENESGRDAVCEKKGEEVGAKGEPAHSGAVKEKSESEIKEKEKLEEAESFESAAREIGEKYRHQRVPVEEIVHRTFGGSLSEKEIERMLQDVPPGFFLTHDETVKMQQRLAMEERLRDLERLSTLRN